MKKGMLSEYFSGFGYKYLAATEVDPKVSRGHEFQGIKPFKEILGTDRREFVCEFIHLSDKHEEGLVSQSGTMTWYDSRENDPKRAAEYRLYYSAEVALVQTYARAGDLIVIARRPNDSLIALIAESGSSWERQLIYLFGIRHEVTGNLFSVETTPDAQLEYASKLILEGVGIDLQEEEQNYLPELLKRFKGTFPATALFSEFARRTLKDVSPEDDPDMALTTWMEQEETLFRTLERHLVSERLIEGFGSDEQAVDRFINFSLSVHNRRKSRAGHALENHLAYLFSARKINFSRGARTENKSRPDFIFPDIEKYHDATFPAEKLKMLGVKTTCKDRWRQVLAEAARIERKHLLTLQPAITEDQTAEMQTVQLQIVIPTAIHATYTPAQQSWIMSVSDFIGMVSEGQKH